MKFEQLTNEVFGAANAGYRLDLSAERMVDQAAMDAIRATRGEAAANALADSFADFDGDLFRGEDGELYTVAFDCGAAYPWPAVIWQRVIHA